MTSHNTYILLTIIKALVESSKEKLNDSLFKSNSYNNERCTKNISYMSLFIENLSNYIYVSEVMQENKKGETARYLDSILALINRIHDPVNKDKDDLSLTHFAADLSLLSSKMSQFFVLQDKIMKLYKWHNPSLTVLTLLVLTCICYSPIILIIIPIVAVPVCQLISNHLGSRNTEQSYAKEKHSEEESLEINLARDIGLKKNVINSIEFIINLTDLQNLITVLLQNINILEGFLSNNEVVKNHRTYAILIITLIIGVCILSFVLAHHLPSSSLFFTILIWTLFLKENPSLLNYCYLKTAKTTNNQLDNHHKAPFLGRISNFFNFKYPKHQKYDYLYEVQQRFNSKSVWQTLVFTKNLDAIILNNKYSLIKKKFITSKPLLKGSKKIENIVPDLGWDFIENSQWEVAKVASFQTWLTNETWIAMQLRKIKNKNQIFGNAEKVVTFVNVDKYDLRFRRLKRKITRKTEDTFKKV